MGKILFLVVASIAMLKAEEVSSINSEEVIGNATVASGLCFDASYLFLKAEIDGLAYGQTLDLSPFTSPTDVLHIKGRSKSPDFEWSSGFTAGVGYIFPQREQYQLSAFWTYLHSSANKSTHQNGNIDQHYITPTWLPLLMGSVADSASASWNLNFNVVDLAFCRNLLFGSWFSVEPKAGLRAAWIDQDYKVKYHGGYNFLDGGVRNTIFQDTSFTSSNDFKGIGARVGAELEFFIAKDFSILGGFFASLLYGEFEVREVFQGGLLQDFGAGAQILKEELNFRKDFTAIRPSFETKIGLRWSSFFNNEQNRMLVGVYYRLDYWLDQNELVNELVARDSTPINPTAINENSNLTGFNPHGNLQLQGLEVELRIEF